MPNVLIIGATRGLGASLANLYASKEDTIVYGTTRSASAPKNDKLSDKIIWVPNIDVSESSVGTKLVNQLPALGAGGGMVEGGIKAFDVVVCTRSVSTEVDLAELMADVQIITAGYFTTEDFVNGPKWDEEVKMYSTFPPSPCLSSFS